MLKDKVVVVGVCGGIAAYKVADLVSRLKKQGAHVHVIMTRSATSFVAPLTFQVLSQNYVVEDMFDRPYSWEIEHISLAQKADIFVIAPATANIIGKVAGGIADDMLSTTIMATRSPVIFAPAMNCNMFENPVVQKNITYLKSLGYMFVEPQVGRLACGDVGKGKMAENDDIIDKITASIAYKKDLKDLNVLVTAGPTQEPIDPVRFISNHSSGKMGYAIAKAAWYRGANVTLITGPTHLPVPKGIDVVYVTTAIEMYEAVMRYYEKASMIIKAAAVSDYRSCQVADNKIKKGTNLEIPLTQNPDILSALGSKVKNQVLIGFSMETEQLEKYAMQKLAGKNLDMIVANNLSEEGAGFAGDTNIVTLIDRKGNLEKLPKMSKEALAHQIVDKGVAIYHHKR